MKPHWHQKGLFMLFLKKRPYVGFILPGFIIYTTLMIVPLITAVYYSFFEWSGIGAKTFIGLKNYINLFFDPRLSAIFWNALGNNFKFVGAVLFIILPLQLLLAYLLDIKIKGYRFFQLIIFLPYVVSTAIIGFFTLLVFDPNIGILNNLFRGLNLMQLESAWFGDPSRAFSLLIIVITWQGIAGGMLIFLANLKGIPNDIIEASIIDGAGRITRFRCIMLPFLVPSLTNNIILGTIWGLTQFDIPFIIGGPNGGVNNSIDFMNLFFYRFAFGGAYYGETSMGFGATISVVLFFIILVIAIFQNKFLLKLEFYR
ncbi:MAG: sugar ABC transporter permease [Spirochaetota bacterium]